MAFVLAHRAIFSVLIGPRTHDQLTSLAGGSDIDPGAEVMDRVDHMVASRVDVKPEDNYNATPPALVNDLLQRR